ncbi:MAG: prepilin-type N-terminal cleavage/methylation domain-containing protein [Colwellia sp.]|nr:prepilin-type N-terminal cleavage/methylation domain-containing protein [Colwellia sp.]
MINKLSTKTRAIARATNSSKAKAKAKHRRSMAFMSSKQQGFTLIELLVVVSILAALAGITSVAMDGYQQDAEEKITRVEMQRIAGAIRRFKADTGYWPRKEGYTYKFNNVDDNTSPANFSFLFNNPDQVPEWTPEYAIGWHGPYINLDSISPVIDDAGESGCPIDNPADYAALQLLPRLNSLVDRFQQIREKNPGVEYCVLIREKKDTSKVKVAEYSGSPYLYEAKFTHTNSALCTKNVVPAQSVTCAALRSFGPDGIDDGGSDASDDIVFVLQVNSKLGE